jgi:sucrose-phosphate synthase
MSRIALGIPLEHVLVVGGSGADEDMMRGNTLAVVVANRHHEELSQLADLENGSITPSRPMRKGILEAVEHYDFFRSCRVPDPIPQPVAEPEPEAPA